ncbi:MAG: 4a-hydroxytetrahydrobiopterin dehydratase [Actinomycetota bacterium]
MWTESDGALRRTFDCASFAEAIAFVVRIAELAERENHHPDIDVRYRSVTIAWTTHSAGGVTDRDRELAVRTDDLFPSGQVSADSV